ncbi:MAG TPA: ABC transporter permease [Candidatus Saccharimonadales bacterium]|jgi:hypothetical protein|nr:ABC transporter permease [Candidatus Saccharimonadales bacterium]
MNWLVWKQHRKLFVILAGVLMLYAVLAIPMGLHAWHMYQHALATCGKTDSCSQLSNTLLWSGWTSSVNPNSGHGAPLLLLLPFLLGVFVGVPLITREYNERTNLLIWTRSISRRKWLTTKLVWILIATVLFAGTLAALATWWSKAGNVLYLNRFTVLMFDTQGIAPIGFAVFAVSIGIALGTWLKRTMVAIGLTLVLVLAAQIVIGNHVRPHYMTPLAYNAPVLPSSTSGTGDSLRAQAPSNSGASWVVSGDLVSKTGQPINWANPPQTCIATNPNGNANAGSVGSNNSAVAVAGTGGAVRDAILSRNGGPAVDLDCLNKIGYYWTTKYQPAYRYWDFQRIEVGLYLALSLIPTGATYWLVLKRDA